MALKFAADTPFGIPAQYHRILAVHYYMDDNAGEVVYGSYIDRSFRDAGKLAATFKVQLAPGVIRNPDTELSRGELYRITKNVAPALRNAEDV